LSPQRSNTHTLPLRSTSTALVDPQVLFSLAQPCSAEYDVRSSGAPAGRVDPTLRGYEHSDRRARDRGLSGRDCGSLQ
jgi:hypothetical protein